MAIYTDFFLATDAELRRAFAGWGETLAEPRVVPRAVDSLAAGRIVLPARREWDDPAHPPADDAPPPRLEGLPMVQMKSVDPLVLAQLLCAEGETFDAALAATSRPALIAPPSAEGALELVRVPERVTVRLATPAGPAREALAARWEAVLLADFATIPNASTRAFEIARWRGAALRILESLGALLETRRPDQALYLLVTV